MQRLFFPPVLRPVQCRLLSTTPFRPASWNTQPAPPRLPKEEQEIFEQLQKQSTGAFSTPKDIPFQTSQPADVDVESQGPTATNAEPAAAVPDPSEPTTPRSSRKRRTPPTHVNQSPYSDPEPGTVNVAAGGGSAEQVIPENQSSPQPAVKTGTGEELHPNIRRGAPPEFEGEVNPKTGETGGPKNEPLRWGHSGDWSYNGRVTDF